MGLCGSISSGSSLTHTESWTSADSVNSEISGDGPEGDNKLDDIGTFTEFEQTNLFGMKCDPERVTELLKNNSASITRLTDARNPRGAGHVACLNQCGPRATDEWVSTLAEALQNNSTLTELHFGSGHHLSETGAAAIAAIVSSTTSLQKMSMVYGTPGIGAGGTRKIAAALPQNNSLEILDLTSNAIGDDGAKALTPALGGTIIPEASESRIEARTDIAPTSEEGEAYVSKKIKDAPSSTEKEDTDGSNNSDGPILVQNIAHSPVSFRVNTTLRSLLLSGNGIGPIGAKSLAIMLKENRSITSMNLTDNMIGDEGSMALSDALLNNSILHTLGLGNNSIHASGAEALARMLESNSSLQRLMLQNHEMHDANHRNQIGAKGTNALAKMLENNKTLYFLNLTDAGTTPESVRSIADSLEVSNTSIIKLETNPNFDPKLERLLSRNMQTHRASQKLKAKLKRLRKP